MKPLFDRLLPSRTKYDPIPQEKRDVVITDRTGKEVFRQNDVEVPVYWSDTATQIAAARWFRGKHGTPEREDGMQRLFERVSDALSAFGRANGYFTDDTTSATVRAHLIRLQLQQKAVFNTPVYLNAGHTEKPRCSACFLLHVEDNYESLTAHSSVEGRVFQHGGGAGVSLSHISHEGRELGRGGIASGPLCFNEGWDRASGAIKSGGSHRRAARDVSMDVRHPDCYRSPEYLATLPYSPLAVDFIREKQIYEGLRRDLAEKGHATGLDSIVDCVLPGQNANRAVGVYDDFMRAKETDADWEVRCPRSGDVVWTYKAREIWDAICYATWACADPTMKFLDTINRWNTSPNGALRLGTRYRDTDGKWVYESSPKKYSNMRITTSNPCGEILFPVPQEGDCLVACNLAMLNLTKYYNFDTNKFLVEEFTRDASIMFMYQDMIVDYSDYPTELGAQWTKASRIIGLSFSDLGGLLMLMGLPYDSNEGRDMAAVICALLLSSAMLTSAELAESLGPCDSWEWNKEPMMECVLAHRSLFLDLRDSAAASGGTMENIWHAADALMHKAIQKAEVTGFRNMQFVSLAPQGTTGLITDCYTTGPEPLVALRCFKSLAGGGVLEQAPECVSMFLRKLVKERCEDFCRYYTNGYELLDPGSPGIIRRLQEKALQELFTYGSLAVLDVLEVKVFETALGVTLENGEVALALSPAAHVDMLAALQQFVSGSISKTVNVPNTATPQDISAIYTRAWKKGVKNIAIYRDGSKGVQVLSTKDPSAAVILPEEIEHADLQELRGTIEKLQSELASREVLSLAHRVKLPEDVASDRRKLKLNGHEAYLHIGLYPNGAVGEIFIRGVQGSFLAGMLDSFATMVSLGLQYGIPFNDLYDKFTAVEFSPNGLVTGLGFMRSFPGYVVSILKEGIDSGHFARIAEAYYDGDTSNDGDDEDTPDSDYTAAHKPAPVLPRPSGDPCPNCGSLMVQSGRCKYCVSCGANTGGCG